MKLASIALCSTLSLTACSPAPVCEVEFRVGPGQRAEPEALETTCSVLRTRLKLNKEPSGFDVAPSSGSSLVITLTRALDDPQLARMRALVERRGRLQFLIVADASTPDFDGQEEERRYDAWRSTHRETDIAQFNQLARESGGPLPSTEWHLNRPEGTLGRYTFACERAMDRASTFTGADLERVYPTKDDIDYPALGFEVLVGRREEFTAFTTRCLRRRMAIVYDGEVLTVPRVTSPLVSSAVVEGHFTQQELEDMLAMLRSGELPLALEFVELRKLR